MSWNRIQNWSLFFVSATTMVILCFLGGRWGQIGSHSFFISFPFISNEQWIIPAGGFLLLWGTTFVTYGLLFFTLPRNLSLPTKAIVIFLGAAICRWMLLPHPPSGDIYRYFWEGYLITEHINPYHYAPSDPFLTHLAASFPFHSKINHPELTAIYPPFFQYIMALVVWSNGTVHEIKQLIMWMDMATVLLIIRLLYQRGQDIRWAILYALNPVILYAFAAHGHLDVFQNFFLISAICLYNGRRWGWMFAVLGLAIQCKYMAALAFPLFLRKDNWLYVGIMFVTVLVPFIPLMDNHPEYFFSSLMMFSQHFAFNGSIHSIFRVALGNNIWQATRICQVFLGIMMLWAWIKLHPGKGQVKNDLLPGCFFIFTVLLLFSPTVHYWYLSWALIFLPFHPHIAWIVLS
ncbi:MAG: hypothetical protein PVI90_09915, partial [Desulfobacteraceae bacterium]